MTRDIAAFDPEELGREAIRRARGDSLRAFLRVLDDGTPLGYGDIRSGFDWLGDLDENDRDRIRKLRDERRPVSPQSVVPSAVPTTEAGE